MATIEQLIDDLDADTLRDICEQQGYELPADTSEKCLRATVLDDYERGFLSGKEITAACVAREQELIDRLDTANRIIADNNRMFAKLFAAAAGKAA